METKFFTVSRIDGDYAWLTSGEPGAEPMEIGLTERISGPAEISAPRARRQSAVARMSREGLLQESVQGSEERAAVISRR